MTAQDYVLLETLKLAVPMHIDELRHTTPEQRSGTAREAASLIGPQGDILQYGGGKRGQVAGVFNRLARGLAAAAYQPGGVKFAGLHWCTDHAHCEDAAAELVEPQPESSRPRRSIVDLELPA